MLAEPGHDRPPASVRVLLAQAHPLLRLGMRAIFERDFAIAVVAEAATADQVVEASWRHRPSVVVLDIDLPVASLAGFVQSLNGRPGEPDVAVLVAGDTEDERVAGYVLCAGARGYVLKSAPPGVLVDAVHAVAAGGAALP